MLVLKDHKEQLGFLAVLVLLDRLEPLVCQVLPA